MNVVLIYKIIKLYGWNKRGQPLSTRKSAKSINFTVIGAISMNGMIGYLILQGGSVSQVFVGFFCYLINQLSQIQNGKHLKDYVFIIDNARSHLKFFLQYMRPGINIVWTPPYTPQLNPIEIIWSQWKKLVYRRESWKNQDELIFAIASASKSLNPGCFLKAYTHTLRFYERCLNKEDIN